MESPTAVELHTKEGHLEKRFSKLTMIGMTFAILNTWIALAGTLGIVMPSGGPVSFVYGFILCVLCNLCIAASLGELSSIWPTAGGQYHWAFAASHESWKVMMSFIVGWINIAGWLTLITTEAFFAAQFFSAAIQVGSGGHYEITEWRTYLIFVAVSLFGVLLNVFGYHLLGRWNEGALLWSILACVVISATILATSEKTHAKYVFTDFSNTTGWSDGMAWILGLLQSALSLIGFDAVAHLTEEMPRPTRDAPIAMITAVAIGGITGIAFILVMLFSLTDPQTILSTPTRMPITEIIHQATHSRAAAVVLTVALAICFVNGTNGSITSGSRLLWAMARDNGTPFSRCLARIEPRLNVPVNAILVAATFNLLFGLLYLGPPVAFNAYIASCTIFLNVSYAAPVLVFLVRGRSAVADLTPDFSLGHRYGFVINLIAVVFVFVTSIFFCFPATYDVNASNMNYVSVVVGLFLIFIAGLWIVKKGAYHGPQFDLILGEDVIHRDAMQGLHRSSIQEEKEARVEGTED
ncbi:uncharacterized protein PV06_02158 [Exophiala oligosperma]|uniref:Choline transport protein n=1 Tax=Exophiala oligosperma TaxID=215243 RepID=A0A0D2EEY6_9EURO|nr:uncharacterized protein PV06_02158 [Exophiala oligosperma]KIW46489.1 hypothetical protein PV06_02158 [Exophiala oligosperma]